MPNTSPTSPAPTPGNTPDNTPLPGGGSWRWSTERAGWVPSAAEPTPAAAPVAAQTLNSQE